MICEIKDKKKMGDFFTSYEHVLAVEAILKGCSKGRVFVDDKDNPLVGVIWNQWDGFYVEAKLYCLDTIKKMILYILENHSLPCSEFVVYIDQAYHKDMDKIMPVKEYEPLQVYGYTYSGNLLDNPKHLQGYQILKLESDLLEQNMLRLDEVVEAINTTWTSLLDFWKYGIGFLVVQAGEVCSYCISEHISTSACEFSIESFEGYEGKGFATALGTCMINTSLKNKLIPYWYCTDDNDGSVHVAEKLGFMKEHTFLVWYFKYE